MCVCVGFICCVILWFGLGGFWNLGFLFFIYLLFFPRGSGVVYFVVLCQLIRGVCYMGLGRMDRL